MEVWLLITHECDVLAAFGDKFEAEGIADGNELSVQACTFYPKRKHNKANEAEQNPPETLS